ncbi:unnamed protein product [Litomosoides sigmodontis]|uniref:Uncharacterized protein n=1 Tax=Litomosoides sigmodontis TaxID=42156 RepID=A0A3P6URD1_LITSI|nr:unnamed protein product [Litomosoides sigmodontis]
MIFNETCKRTPLPSKLAHRTYSSIRCSRQTQRTQLKSIENTSLNEQHHQHLRRGYQTISEGCDLTIECSGSQNNEQRNVCSFVRGSTQLRDSRRKTAEQWQTRKYSSANESNCVEEIRSSQKVKFSLPANNRTYLRNVTSTAEEKKSLQISATKRTRTHLLPSDCSSTAISAKSKSRHSQSNVNFLCNSHLLYLAKSKKMHVIPAGLRQIHVDTSAQNQIPLNEEVC